MCRYVAKNLVAAGLADRCEVQIAYAIGVCQPLSLMVNTFETKNWNDQKPIVTGYTTNSDRYWASLHVQNAPDVPAKNWNDQKAVVTGYTQPGDKYFSTKALLVQ